MKLVQSFQTTRFLSKNICTNPTNDLGNTVRLSRQGFQSVEVCSTHWHTISSNVLKSFLSLRWKVGTYPFILSRSKPYHPLRWALVYSPLEHINHSVWRRKTTTCIFPYIFSPPFKTIGIQIMDSSFLAPAHYTISRSPTYFEVLPCRSPHSEAAQRPSLHTTLQQFRIALWWDMSKEEDEELFHFNLFHHTYRMVQILPWSQLEGCW